MAYFKNVPTNGQNGKISYNVGIVTGIVSLAVSEISGVAILAKGKKSSLKRVATSKKEGIKIDFDKNGIHVDVSLKVYYGYIVPDIAFRIQENIKHSVESMTEFKISKVDVHVLGIIFPEDTDVIIENV